MLDDNTAIKIALVLPAVVFYARYFFAGRRRGPNLSVRGADTWSMEKFGIWWIGRALVFLVIVAFGAGVAFGGKGSFGGALVLFCFSAAGAVVEFLRGKI
jgi:hypothetical protein